MANQIIKQPNGKYCIFSDSIDNITHFNMTEQEIIDEWVILEKFKIEEKVKSIISQLEAGVKPYYQFTKSYHEMLDIIQLIHGEEEIKEIKSEMEEII